MPILILQQKLHNLLAELVHMHKYACESLKADIGQITIELSQNLFLNILLEFWCQSTSTFHILSAYNITYIYKCVNNHPLVA